MSRRKRKPKPSVATIADGKYHSFEVRVSDDATYVYVDGKLTKDPAIRAFVLGHSAAPPDPEQPT